MKRLIEFALAVVLVGAWAAVAISADRHLADAARAASAGAGTPSGDAAQAHLAALFGHRLGEQLDQRVDGVDVRGRRPGQATQLDH
jgi:hypothetical protein